MSRLPRLLQEANRLGWTVLIVLLAAKIMGFI
jgi:hypothetical protein